MKGRIKNFFEEFKKFITRGNILDMAVGVIVGGAFTSIVNALSNNILKPIINWILALILGKKGLSGAITMLSPAFKEVEVLDDLGAVIGKTQELDLANSIYIDWGAFISAVINFLLIAFVLFSIVKMMNNIAKAHERAVLDMDINEKKAVAKIMREQKVNRKAAQAIYDEQVEQAKAKKAEEERLAAEKAAADAAAEAEKATANTRLLEEIRDLLKNK
ncbi:MAG: large conductance mechanosensitive channel protein MscL [Clostridiales bacterium]|nr:large conductance mechanosensitive channel protein MscL [Clostridiales bacterium]